MSAELTRILEYLSARGQLRKHEAMELLASTDCRKEGERHVKAAALLIDAQATLAICTELAGGAHLREQPCTCNPLSFCPRHR